MTRHSESSLSRARASVILSLFNFWTSGRKCAGDSKPVLGPCSTPRHIHSARSVHLMSYPRNQCCQCSAYHSMIGHQVLSNMGLYSLGSGCSSWMICWSHFFTLFGDSQTAAWILFPGDYDLKVMRQEYYISQQKKVSLSFPIPLLP